MLPVAAVASQSLWGVPCVVLIGHPLRSRLSCCLDVDDAGDALLSLLPSQLFSLLPWLYLISLSVPLALLSHGSDFSAPPSHHCQILLHFLNRPHA